MEEETEKTFAEGMIRKGGLNSKPSTPRPDVAPVPQEPEKTTQEDKK